MDNQWFERREVCPACTSGNIAVIYQSRYDESPIKDYLYDFYSPQGKVEMEYLIGANYILNECTNCGLIFQKEIPNDFLMERLYDHWIDPQKDWIQHNEHENLGYSLYNAQEIMQILAYLDKTPSLLNFLDYGMGWGRWALMAKAFGCNSCGIEISLPRIQNAEKNGIEVIPWSELPINHFDFINSEQVFEHIPDPFLTIKKLKSALKLGGILKISVPYVNDIKRILKLMDWKAPKGSKNSINPVAPLEHINYFSRKTILQMAETAQMREVFIPIHLQYRFTTNWGGITKIAKNLTLPLYRNLIRRNNYVFLQKYA